MAQTIAYDVALAGGRSLYLTGELTPNEFTARARKISEARDGELTDEAAATWRDRVAFADVSEALPLIWQDPVAWRAVCAEFSLIVVDAVSDVGAALDLKFSRDNDDWLKFYAVFVGPCQGRVAVLLLDNIGHGEDASRRAMGASAKGHKIDIRLSSKRREDPSSLLITCEKARPTRAPFRRGDRWVAYEAGCMPAAVFDASQIELEKATRSGPDPRMVVVAALREKSPQGQNKLEDVLRAAGLKGRSDELRDMLKAMVKDPACPVLDTGKGLGIRA